MWLVTLTYHQRISMEEAEACLIKKLRELPENSEHLAVTHREDCPHHHVLIEKDAAEVLAKQWTGKTTIHEVDFPLSQIVSYLRGARFTSFYSSSFEKGPDSDNSASNTGELSDGN